MIKKLKLLVLISLLCLNAFTQNKKELKLIIEKMKHDSIMINSDSSFYFENRDRVYGSSALSLISSIQLSKWIQYFKSAGIKIERGPEETMLPDGSFNSIYVFDPDGHRLEIFCDMASIDDDGTFRSFEGNRIEEAKVIEV